MFSFSGLQACGILAPQPWIEPVPPVLEGEVLTIGLPGKSLIDYLKGTRGKRKTHKFHKNWNIKE